ncbi:solute carrier family 25 member 44-like [Mizuhopecten yessoensis]|uniref:Solute carrier family 25 member 44 n=1 Tax=Mizuhopecten yessoensis TaxID=6573 RepID=A0A210PIS6_MIZYE|nr:solute carrier family 25 member 44-like [Mizuhopecten yessoensis]OWF36374.1 Solute carrier family 25 member 44 [Mizuhopecten yessoensis]
MSEEEVVERKLRIVQLDMMDKRKYYPMSLGSSLLVRFIQYPLTLVRTRLQVQHGKDVYKGTFDALVKIRATEGLNGLYRGFGVHSIQAVNSLVYISIYENIRQIMMNQANLQTFEYKSYLSSFVGGFSASFVSQTIAVPTDIVSQHMMLLGQNKQRAEPVPNKVKVKLERLQGIHIQEKGKKVDVVKAIVSEVYRKEGVGGFYRGYFISLSVYGLGSSLWWPFYEFYANNLVPTSPHWVPQTLVHGISASMAGITSVTITNSMELVRVRMQVGRSDFKDTVKKTWREEGLGIFTKGLTARIINVVPFSFLIMTSYSTIKHLSLKDEYKEQVHW